MGQRSSNNLDLGNPTGVNYLGCTHKRVYGGQRGQGKEGGETERKQREERGEEGSGIEKRGWEVEKEPDFNNNFLSKVRPKSCFTKTI